MSIWHIVEPDPTTEPTTPVYYGRTDRRPTRTKVFRKRRARPTFSVRLQRATSAMRRCVVKAFIFERLDVTLDSMDYAILAAIGLVLAAYFILPFLYGPGW